MAVAPTGDIFKTLEFDGESSKDYGVYITGEAVFNAPERDIEMISIPGRNGAFALDKGRFENIEVRYPAGIFADNELDFAEAISDFRNFLCSKKGYCRLTDDYNPDEYRLAIYKSGLEVTPAMLKGGEFEIVFDCKPQRYLMSGEAPINASNNEVVFNPTLYEAHPLLEVEGYGTITINGSDIELTNDTFGHVVLADNQPFPVNLDAGYYDPGDTITLSGADSVSIILGVDNTFSSASDLNGIDSIVQDGNRLFVSASPMTITDTFSAGTTSTVYKNITFTYETDESGTTKKATAQISVFFRYTADTEVVSSFASVALVPISGYVSPTFIPTIRGSSGKATEISVDSTATILGHPTYVDCDLGECYKITNGEITSLNRYIDLGSKLPELSPGANEIETTSNITSLEIVPRWWKV